MTSWPPDVWKLCLVASADLTGGRALAEVVAAAVAGGVTLVQLREKTASTRAFLAQAEALKGVLRGSGVPLVINDRVDVALAVGADGVHVGQDDMPVALVRSLVGADMIVGLSITTDAELHRADARAADYLGIGPLFPQTTKLDAAPPLGLAGLRRMRGATRQTLMAIGGIAVANAAAVMAAGADGLAVVSAIMAAPDPRAAARALRDMVDAARP